MADEDEIIQARKIVQSFVDDTLADRKVAVKKAMEIDPIGHTIGELVELMGIPTLTKDEYYAMILDRMLTGFTGNRNVGVTILPPCEIFELQGPDDTTGVQLYREDEPLNIVHLLKAHPELKDRVIAATNDFFGIRIYRIRPIDHKEVIQ